jgi:hypothetical protein
MPLLVLWASLLPGDQEWLALALTLTVIAILGRLVEHDKRWWRLHIEHVARGVRTGLPRLLAS